MGPHEKSHGETIMVVSAKSRDAERRDIAFKIARVAHWLVSDPGFTRKMAARDLAQTAREIDPEMANLSLGDAK